MMQLPQTLVLSVHLFELVQEAILRLLLHLLKLVVATDDVHALREGDLEHHHHGEDVHLIPEVPSALQLPSLPFFLNDVSCREDDYASDNNRVTQNRDT